MNKGDTESPGIIFHKYMWIYKYLKTGSFKSHWTYGTVKIYRKHTENKYLWALCFEDSIILEEVEYGTLRGNVWTSDGHKLPSKEVCPVRLQT